MLKTRLGFTSFEMCCSVVSSSLMRLAGGAAAAVLDSSRESFLQLGQNELQEFGGAGSSGGGSTQSAVLSEAIYSPLGLNFLLCSSMVIFAVSRVDSSASHFSARLF